MTDFLNTYKTQPAELSVNEVAKILRCSNQMVFKLCLHIRTYHTTRLEIAIGYPKRAYGITFFGTVAGVMKRSMTINAIQSKEIFIPLWGK